MATQDVPGGPGVYARRDDLGNVKKIQREGKNISEAPQGEYGEGKALKELSSAIPNSPSATAAGANPLISAVPSIDVFAPGSQAPLSDGALGGPGRGLEAQQNPIDSIDQTSVLARAMLLANPNSVILANIVNAFNEEGR